MSLSLNEKILQIMSEVHAIGKRGYNDKQKYKYVETVDVIREVKALMIQHKLRLKSEVLERTREEAGKAKLTILTIKYTLIDIESDESDTTTVIAEGMDSGDKGSPKAMTMGLKYYLRDTFMLEFADDAEKPDKPEPQGVTPTPEPQYADEAKLAEIKGKWSVIFLKEELGKFAQRKFKKPLNKLNAEEANAILAKLNKTLIKMDMLDKQRRGIFGAGRKKGLTDKQTKQVAYKYCDVKSMKLLNALQAYEVSVLIDSMVSEEVKSYISKDPSKEQLLEGIKEGIDGLSTLAAMGGTA